MERKEFLKHLGITSIVMPMFINCNKTDDPTAANTTSSSSSSSSSSNSNSNGSCTVTNSETEGPFPTKTPSSLVQTDIRSDRTGVNLSVEITIQNKKNSCQALEGAIVDIWHCDKDGNYSEYGGTQMQSTDYTTVHFLRGRQVTDSNGKVSFITIFPSWYQSRATHIHAHVYNSSGKSLLVTQIAFLEGSNSAVELVNAATTYGYTKGMSGYTYNAKKERYPAFQQSLVNR
ncbi:MAG: intradiol ring-cleavage dioxygenase [Cytophagales bacterium]|jgi:protocatechuate 3,4-dioxygenase beta subunit|nr:intradiol ring-cleavage dioxygenase [Bacteroidota bacterium]MBS1982213.1 intradiol ring-cleavage dioxygenase [Bacteroidota bacterium]WHZ06341.1 MAG: intradiol ring-cleavage dioxygenase [Cytophagales bacterium]